MLNTVFLGVLMLLHLVVNMLWCLHVVEYAEGEMLRD